MARMIPDVLSPDIKSNAEKRVFEWFKYAPGTEDWVVLHSLGIVNHTKVIHGETDFLVLAPLLGMFALEVKGGRVRRTLGKWQFIDRYGKYTEKVRGPFDQAWEGIYSIKASIATKLDSSHEYLKNILFGIGVMFPDVEYGSVGVDEEKWQVFDCDDGQDVKGFIECLAEEAVKTRERLQYQINPKMYPSIDDINYLTDILRGDFDANVPLRIKQKYAESAFLELTNEQSMCIQQLEDNPRILIRGTAGTGKTLIAIEAAKLAIANGEKVAFFCYNKALGEWLSKHFSQYPLIQRPMFVGSFHSYLNRLLISKGMNMDVPSGTDPNTFFSQTLPDKVLEIIGDDYINYDRIIIDEAQDLLSDKYLKIISKSLDGSLANGKWIMLGDFSMQAIFDSGLSEQSVIDSLQEEAFFTMFKLKKNCRNTKKICVDIETIVGIPENSAFPDDDLSPAVNHIVYKDAIDQKNKLVTLLNSLLETGIKRSDITILSPKKLSNSVVSMLDGITVKEYSLDEVSQIRFSTIQAFKGLESSTVILTDIDSYEDEKLIYVGLSRARFALHILESEDANGERALLFAKRRLGYDR